MFYSMKKGLFIFLVLTGVQDVPVFAKDIRILCPYAGSLINTVSTTHGGYTISLTDRALLEGLFFQRVRPGLFQVNAFLYHSSNINYSTVWGGHVMGDVYFLPSRWGACVAGAGSEFISIIMEADSNPMPLTTGGHTGFSDFEMNNTVYTPFVRAGYRCTLTKGAAKIALFPWLGAEYQGVRGRIQIDFPAFQYPRHATLVADDWFAMAGIGANATIFHFLDLEAKYHDTFDTKIHYPTVSAMANIFLSRRVGVSYRFKYMEMSMGSNTYHMAGVALIY